MGIEPTRPAWKAGILPLNYTRIFYFLCDKAYFSTAECDCQEFLRKNNSFKRYIFMSILTKIYRPIQKNNPPSKERGFFL